MRRFLLAALALLPLAAAAACDDAANPFDEVTIVTDSTLVLRAPTAGVESASALDASTRPPFSRPRTVRPELPEFAGEWDFALRQNGSTFSFVTQRGVVLGASRSSFPLIARSNTAFDAIDEAERSRATYSDSSIVLAEGAAYTYRTRAYAVSGGTCFNYGKLRVLRLDPATGTARLEAAVNPRCDDVRLVPD